MSLLVMTSFPPLFKHYPGNFFLLWQLYKKRTQVGRKKQITYNLMPQRQSLLMLFVCAF